MNTLSTSCWARRGGVVALLAAAALGCVAAALPVMPVFAQAQLAAQPAASQPPLPLVPAAPATRPAPLSRWTTAQIRQAFDLADSDSDGVLTRVEAQRATVMPRSFEDMDRNKDGVISREEFEAAFTR